MSTLSATPTPPPAGPVSRIVGCPPWADSPRPSCASSCGGCCGTAVPSPSR
ncbi:hypothetical protein NKG94_45855 [Micromonospora sp. M12]